MRPSLASRIGLGFAVAVVLAPAAAQAQRGRPNLPNIVYNPAPPGARSLAMGATFIGIADDATAAESNPAGLTILRKPEVSAHARFSSYTTKTYDPSGPVEFDDGGNTVAITTQEFNSKVTSPNFLSFVYPFQKFALSGYYYQSGNFDSSSHFEYLDPNCCTTLQDSSFGFRLENYAVAGAYKVHPRLSIGGSVRLTRLLLDASDTSFFGPAPGLPTEDFVASAVHDEDTDVTFNLGVMVNPAGKISGGFVYKYGGKYHLTNEFLHQVRFVSEDPFLFTDFEDSPEGTGSSELEVKIPDVWGGGVAYRPTDHWTIAGDVVFLTYSDLRGDDPFGFFSSDLPDDKVEIHLGGEYTFLRKDTPISLRAGYYHEPDHDAIRLIDTRQNHFTFGGGVVLQENYQIDGAVNLSEDIREALLSMVFRF